MLAKQGRPNHLVDEKSPYLLEHAFNPVDWYPWGKAAFDKAKAEDKPIFLSIGYSTCHWCHVMRDESFEDEKIAAVLNEKFVSIKVDREERPDLDEIYMKAVTALTGSGGWPLSVFLTPDLKPFYGGTYFPPVPGRGLPAFPEILNVIADSWKNKRQDVLQSSDELTRIIREGYELRGGGALSKTLLDNAYAVIVARHDSQFGGFGRAPKFPMPSYLSFLLRYHSRTGRDAALNPVMKTLDAMASGGIHDQLGGGFHRYSTDRYWLVPHFEKMLYDNAILARVYADAYRVTRAERYAATARDTLHWILEEMASPEGGFYSAQDADTVEGEGYYYSWTPADVSSVLGEKDAAVFCDYFGVTREGNFGGRSILSISGSAEKTGQRLGVTAGQVVETLENGKRALLRVRRKQRSRPAVDDKILSSWNGLAISAFANAYQALQEQTFLTAAKRCAEFILANMVKENGDRRLYRRCRGGDVAIEGNLEDYSFLIQGFIDLYEASFDTKWMEASAMLAQEMIELFWDEKGAGFFLTPPGEGIAAIKEGYDGPTPSGNSVASLDLLRLAEFTGKEEFRERAENTLRLFAEEMESSPESHAEMLSAVDFSFGSREIVIALPDGTLSSAAVVKEVQSRYLPTKVLAVASRNPGSLMAPLTEGKVPLNGMPTVYICENFACKAPLTDIAALREKLDAIRTGVAGAGANTA